MTAPTAGSGPTGPSSPPPPRPASPPPPPPSPKISGRRDDDASSTAVLVHAAAGFQLPATPALPEFQVGTAAYALQLSSDRRSD